MPDVDTMATWAFFVVVVFVGWLALGIMLAMLWSWHRRTYRRWREDEYPYERRWREDDGNDP
jgi:hypothetical protein